MAEVSESQADFPPRDSRSFRVIVVRDARWNKREPFRSAQIYIWDILNFVQTEGGKPGHFDVGERYLVRISTLSSWRLV